MENNESQSPMQKMRRVMQLALQNLTEVMREQQHNILLQRAFGLDAIVSTTFYEPGDIAHAKMLFGNLEQEYQENLKLAIEIKKALDAYSEAEWGGITEAFFKDLIF